METREPLYSLEIRWCLVRHWPWLKSAQKSSREAGQLTENTGTSVPQLEVLIGELGVSN